MAYEQVLAALADPTRRGIFEALREEPMTVGQLAEGQPVSRPAVSQHLKVLREAGLVVARPDGARRMYRIDPDGLRSVRAWVDSFWDDALTAFVAHAEGVK